MPSEGRVRLQLFGWGLQFCQCILSFKSRANVRPHLYVDWAVWSFSIGTESPIRASSPMFPNANACWFVANSFFAGIWGRKRHNYVNRQYVLATVCCSNKDFLKIKVNPNQEWNSSSSHEALKENADAFIYFFFTLRWQNTWHKTGTFESFSSRPVKLNWKGFSTADKSQDGCRSQSFSNAQTKHNAGHTRFRSAERQPHLPETQKK